MPFSNYAYLADISGIVGPAGTRCELAECPIPAPARHKLDARTACYPTRAGTAVNEHRLRTTHRLTS